MHIAWYASTHDPSEGVIVNCLLAFKNKATPGLIEIGSVSQASPDPAVIIITLGLGRTLVL